MIDKGRRRLNEVYDHYNDLLQSIENYENDINAEKEQESDNVQLQRLLDLQIKRIDLIKEFLLQDGEELIRDLTDRLHVIQEAREYRFN